MNQIFFNMHNKKLTVLLLICGLMLPLAANSAEEEYIFSYDYEGASHNVFGVQRNVQTDVAMLIKEPSLVGFEIIGVSVDVPTKEGCTCDPIAAAWLTNKLRVEGEYNIPDIQEVKGEIKNFGTDDKPELRLDLTFPEPYTLTEEGVYVGYSLSVTNCNIPGSGWSSKYPIVTVCDIDKPESLMIHCTKGASTLPQKYPEWTNLGASMHQALAMRVILRGHTLENAAVLEPWQTMYAEPGKSGQVYTNLNNLGTNPIRSIEYSYTLNGDTDSPLRITKEITLDQPVNGQVGSYVTLDLPFVAPEKVGKYEVNLTVDKVNGLPNDYRGNTTLNMEVVPFLPTNRIPIEDYTGTWCSYCPAVYVTLRQMKDKYGDEVIPVTFHSGDQMQGVKPSDFPSPVPGLPRVYIGNRETPVSTGDIESRWLFLRRELAPADIDVKIFWADEAHESLRAESTVKFVYDHPDAEYMVTYAMLEDDLSDPSWAQSSNYGDYNFDGPYWDLFCGKGPYVRGIVYSDVVVSFPSTKGIENSIPASIEGETAYMHSSVLDLKDAVGQYVGDPNYGKSIIMDPDKLRVVAYLIDGKTGNVCNAASSGYSKDAPLYSDTSSIALPAADGGEADVVSTEYFSLEGLRLNRLPQNGTVIIVNHLADGTITTEKKTL